LIVRWPNLFLTEDVHPILMTKDMIEIDGGQGEGGGQILRTSIALSALTGKDVVVKNIRAGRPKPGLAAQHLAAIKGVASICEGRLEGATLGSIEVRFYPGPVRGGRHVIDVGTAGSITLVAQACLLTLARCIEDFDLVITGGTDVRLAPSITYDELIIFPQLRKMDFDVSMVEMRRGFFPQGGGMARLKGHGNDSLSPLDLEERGRFLGISGVAFVQNLPRHVADRMAMESKRLLIEHQPVDMRIELGDSQSTGAGMALCARYENTVLGSSALGEKGLSSEKIAAQAAEDLEKEMLFSTLDVHAADQLLPYLSLCDEPSEFLVREITPHLSTQMQLLPTFLPVKFEVDEGRRIRVLPNRT
jgi:RNA 3'-terminal phosphate cyclase (ATP)